MHFYSLSLLNYLHWVENYNNFLLQSSHIVIFLTSIATLKSIYNNLCKYLKRPQFYGGTHEIVVLF